MTVQREVVRDQVQLVLEQYANTLAERTHQPLQVSPPQEPMVDEYHVGPPLSRLAEELRRGRDAGRDPFDLRAPRDLQAVERDVLHLVDPEQVVEVRHELVAIHTAI